MCRRTTLTVLNDSHVASGNKQADCVHGRCSTSSRSQKGLLADAVAVAVAEGYS